MTAVAEVWSADRVGVRLSPISRNVGDTPLDSDPQATHGLLAGALGRLGLAWLHCVEGHTREASGAAAFDFTVLHQAFGGSYIANDSYDRAMAIRAVRTGYADMIAFARPFIGNPDLVARLHGDAPLVDAPHELYYGGGAAGYTDFPPLQPATGQPATGEPQ